MDNHTRETQSINVSPPRIRSLLDKVRWPGETIILTPERRNGPLVRVPFTFEEALFIWYHIIDAGLTCDELHVKFEAQFPDTKTTVCRLRGNVIRLCKKLGITDMMWMGPEVAGMEVMERCGMVGRTGVWFPSMEEGL